MYYVCTWEKEITEIQKHFHLCTHRHTHIHQWARRFLLITRMGFTFFSSSHGYCKLSIPYVLKKRKKNKCIIFSIKLSRAQGYKNWAQNNNWANWDYITNTWRCWKVIGLTKNGIWYDLGNSLNHAVNFSAPSSIALLQAPYRDGEILYF